MQSNQRCGASPQEWKLITESALRPYVLPIVSTPEVPSIENSALARANMRGKIPSVIVNGYACGLKQWPSYQSTDEELAAWSRNRDYGFCVRLGHEDCHQNTGNKGTS